VSEIKLEPSRPTASIELREISIDGADVNHPFLQRMRRENAARAAAAFPVRAPLPAPRPPDLDALLLQQRLANQAVLIAQERQAAAEDAEQIAKADLEAARVRVAELAAADDGAVGDLTQARKLRIALVSEERRQWLKAGGAGDRPELPPAPAVSLARAALDDARVELEVCVSVLADASAAAVGARQEVHEAIMAANLAAHRVIGESGLHDLAVGYIADIESAIAKWDLLQVANMQHFPLEPGRAIQRLQALSPTARTVISGPPRHTIEIGTAIGGVNSGRGAAYAAYLQQRFRELRAILPEEEPVVEAAE
jgi:hypothetical protein